MTPDAIVAALQGIVGPDAVEADPAGMGRFLEDWWGRARGDALCVVRPGGTEEVAAVVALCAREGVPIVPQGGNTSVCAGSVPQGGFAGIVLSLARMNAVLDVNPRDNAITVQAGCVLATVQAAAAAVERLFPLSLGAEGSCQVGGNIATNAGGTAVLRYGNMRDLVLGLEVVLADGRIWRGLRSLRKNNSGYDLRNLFVGAEGTLGIITAATLKLFPTQPHSGTALAALPTVEAATDLGLALGAAFPSELVALELISESQVRLALDHVPGNTWPLPLGSPWFLLVELASNADPQQLTDRLLLALAPGLEDGTVRDAVVASSEAQRTALWRLRHSVTEANRREGMGISHDVAVPVFRIPDFLRDATAAVERVFPLAEIVVVGHLGDGNMHYNVMFRHEVWARIPDQAAARREANRVVYDAAAALGGTFSAEHGIGTLHLPEMAHYKDPVELELMRAIKRQLDPLGLMNPGRVLPPA